ncbi:holin [Nonomuraea sp. PA05]|nr:holin [Nonomuraea sp. PA05]
MPRRAASVCSTPGCPNLCDGGRCPECRSAAEKARGSASQRGYGSRHRDRFRTGVLAKHPTCVLCGAARSTVADHHPMDRRELVARGLDPDDPKYGRGLCASCHGKATQANESQKGGWNAR